MRKRLASPWKAPTAGAALHSRSTTSLGCPYCNVCFTICNPWFTMFASFSRIADTEGLLHPRDQTAALGAGDRRRGGGHGVRCMRHDGAGCGRRAHEHGDRERSRPGGDGRGHEASGAGGTRRLPCGPDGGKGDRGSVLAARGNAGRCLSRPWGGYGTRHFAAPWQPGASPPTRTRGVCTPARVTANPELNRTSGLPNKIRPAIRRTRVCSAHKDRRCRPNRTTTVLED